MRWFKNSAGRPDAMLTLAVVSTLVMLLKVLAAGVTIAVAGKSLALGGYPDGALVAAIIGPPLTAYVSRRNGIGGRGIASDKEDTHAGVPEKPLDPDRARIAARGADVPARGDAGPT